MTLLAHATDQWFAIVALFAILALIAVWSRRETVARAIAVIAFIVAVPTSFVAVATSLGWSTPVIPYVTASPGKEARVLGYKNVEGVGIYVLLDMGAGEPRYYWLPWNKERASELEKAMHGDGGGRPGAIVLIPFEPSLDEHHTPLIHPLPQPKLMLDKPRAEPGPHIGDTP